MQYCLKIQSEMVENWGTEKVRLLEAVNQYVKDIMKEGIDDNIFTPALRLENFSNLCNWYSNTKLKCGTHDCFKKWMWLFQFESHTTVRIPRSILVAWPGTRS